MSDDVPPELDEEPDPDRYGEDGAGLVVNRRGQGADPTRGDQNDGE